MIVGWDVSTSAIGICVRDDIGKVIEFGVIYPKGDSHREKHIDAAAQVVNFCKRVCPKADHFVEERLGGFTGGLTTKQTLMALAAMNAVVSFILHDFGSVVHIPVRTVDRIVGFKKPKDANRKVEVIKLVRTLEPSLPYAETDAGNYVRGTDDMADAWMLAQAGTRVKRGEASIGQPKKAAGRKGKTGGAQVDGKDQGGVRIPVPRKARKRRLPKLQEGESEALGQPGG
jgi:hypothetical protein